MVEKIKLFYYVAFFLVYFCVGVWLSFSYFKNNQGSKTSLLGIPVVFLLGPLILHIVIILDLLIRLIKKVKNEVLSNKLHQQ